MDDIDSALPMAAEGGDGGAGVAPIGNSVASINVEPEGGGVGGWGGAWNPDADVGA
jgi:hypothetical protein